MTGQAQEAFRTVLRGALALALAATTACGGGGGGGGGGGPTQPQPGITFTPSSVAAPAVRLVRGPGSSGNVLEVQVQAEALPSVYGVAFDLTFPAGLLRFDGSTEGEFLGRDGTQTSLQVAQSGAGRLVVGYTRLGAAGMIGGSGTMMTLRFTAVGPGGGNLAFSRNQLLDTRANEIRGPSWGGGSVQVAL